MKHALEQGAAGPRGRGRRVRNQRLDHVVEVCQHHVPRGLHGQGPVLEAHFLVRTLEVEQVHAFAALQGCGSATENRTVNRIVHGRGHRHIPLRKRMAARTRALP